MKKGAVERDLSQLVTGASAVILISCVCIYTLTEYTLYLFISRMSSLNICQLKLL